MTILADSRKSDDTQHIVARIERLPYCSWHVKMRAIIGSAWFFDAFDSITIAYVLPPLIALWHINPQQIGSLVAVGFGGQLIGAICAGWLAERVGRRTMMLATLLIFALGALACAFATSYDAMWWLRLIQGIGLGGETPLMAAYINEFAKAAGRGRFSISAQVWFSIGLPGAALFGVFVVPNLGWQWMFILGAIPALIAIPLRTMLPESPRWLASRGRFDEASDAVKFIEDIAVREGKALPPVPRDLPEVEEAKPRIADLFKGIYLRRTVTVWLLWIATYFVTYGLTTWAPSLFNIVYHLPVRQSLVYGLILSGVSLCGALLTWYLIDAIGRRPVFCIGLGVACVPLLCFAFLGELTAVQTLVMISSAFFFCGTVALSLATYTAEIYPTQLRALGGGVASAVQRLASMAGPIVVGFVLPLWGVNTVFVVFGVFAFVGALVAYFFAIETRAHVLEHLSPALGARRSAK